MWEKSVVRKKSLKFEAFSFAEGNAPDDRIKSLSKEDCNKILWTSSNIAMQSKLIFAHCKEENVGGENLEWEIGVVALLRLLLSLNFAKLGFLFN